MFQYEAECLVILLIDRQETVRKYLCRPAPSRDDQTSDHEPPSTMHITRHELFDSLAGSKVTWNELSHSVPFRTWEWCEGWWRNYGCGANGQSLADRDLFVLVAWNERAEPIGIAPWYRQTTRGGTRIVRFLGDGQVCSEYASILCRPEDEATVVAALAEWLTAADERSNEDSANQWDRLELTPIDVDDSAVSGLLQELEHRGNRVVRDSAMSCWRVALPPTWDDYLKKCSKQLRNRLRYADRTWMQSGRVKLRTAPGDGDVDVAFDVLIDLHQRRWQSRGLPGCFSSTNFAVFHREVWKQFSADGCGLIYWLEADGKPIAVDYVLLGGGAMYSYQSGLAPDALEMQPGQLMNMVAIQQAIAGGFTAYDFLRGDEPYKAHLRAEPRPMLAAYVVPQHAGAQLRYAAWNAGRQMRGWAKRGLQVARGWRGRVGVRRQESGVTKRVAGGAVKNDS